MKCTMCGAEIKDGMKFCTVCGQKTAEAKAVQDKAARDKAARDKAARDKAARDKAARDKAAPNKAVPDKAGVRPDAVKPENREKHSSVPSVICPECGAPNAGNRKFCTVCGTALHQAEAGPGNPVPVPGRNGSTHNKGIKKVEKQKTPKRKRKSGCLITFLLVLLILIAAVAAAVFLQTSGKVDLLSKVDSVLLRKAGNTAPLMENYTADQSEKAAVDRDGVLAGYVVDEKQEPMEGVSVAVYKEGEESPLVRLISGENGYFGWKMRDMEQEYHMVLEQEGYLPLTVYPVLSDCVAPTGILDIGMVKEGMGNGPVTLEIYKAGESVEPGTSADIVFRSGYNNTEGDAVLEIQSDASGKASGELPAGVYTAQVSASDLASAYVVVCVDGRKDITKVCCPDPAYTQDWDILLSWQGAAGNVDLDGCVMYDKEELSYLNASASKDRNGSVYLSDDKGENGCELASLKTEKDGKYYYFASDYMNALAGTMDADVLSGTGARVWVYHKGVLAQAFDVPQEKGAVWAVCAISSDMLWPAEKMYTDKTGLDWFWDKDVLTLTALNDGNTVSNEHSYARMAASGDWLYFRNPNDGNKLYYMTRDGEQVTKITDEEVKDLHIVGDYIYYAQEGQINNLVRIKNDGSERTQFTNETFMGDASYISLESVIGSKLYYVYRRNGADVQISYYDMDTGGISVIRNMMVGDAGRYINPNFTGEWVYYMKADGLYRCKMDGSDEECINQDADWLEFVLQDGWIYYITGNGQKIGCMRADGAGDTILSQPFEAGTISKLSVCGEKLYCINGTHLYQLSWDGKTHKMMSATDWYNIYDDQIYFYTYGINGINISRSDMDGNNIQQIYTN